MYVYYQTFIPVIIKAWKLFFVTKFLVKNTD